MLLVKGGAGVLLLLHLLLGAFPPCVAAQGDLRTAGRRLETGLQAARAGNTEAYYTEALAASKLVPPHPVLYYHLARAAALSGRLDTALNTLARLTVLGVARDPATDSAFASLQSSARFQTILKDIAKATAPLVASDTAFVIDAPNLVVENLAFDPRSSVFYVGSMARQSILRADRRGRTTPFVPRELNIGQPLGMRVDTASRTLWVAAIWPVDSAAGRPVQRSAVFNIDIETGRIRRRYVPADSMRPHLLNDFAIAPDGHVYVTDSEAAAIWRIRNESEELERWVELPTTVVYPNGIALSSDARTLFVAHQTGILAVDRQNRRIQELAAPENVMLMGIDGLYATPNGLVGVQNTTPVHQVVAVRLDYSADAVPIVACAVVLERRHPAYVIPTTGTLVGSDLYYVANSELRRLDRRGKLTSTKDSSHTTILRLPTQPTASQVESSCAGSAPRPDSR
jgi:DNA-binding beta-propeller fold protein YncE